MLVANLVLFQCLWFAAVLGASRDLWWTALPALAIMILVCLRFSERRPQDLRLMSVSLLVGLVVETAMVTTGWIDYAAMLPGNSVLAPIWILVMWGGMGLTLNHSMWPIVKSRPIAALAGAVFGPLAYFGAARLGAIESFGMSTLATAALLAGTWALCLVVLGGLANKWREQEPVP